MIIKISLLVAWIISCLVKGKCDAYFFYSRNSDKSDKSDAYKINWLFALLPLIGVIYGISFKALDTGVFIFSLILIFPFLYTGMYYWAGNFIDKSIYPKKWFDSSTTSESFLEFSIVPRIFLAFVGLVGIITALTF